jgi:hypothetical protein
MRYLLGLLFFLPVISTAEKIPQPFSSDIEVGVFLGSAKASEGSFDNTGFIGIYFEKLFTKNFSFYANIREFDEFVVNKQSKVIIDYNEKFALGIGAFGHYNKHLSGYARINFISWELDSVFSGNTLASESDTSFGFSLGVKYLLLNKLGVNVEFFSVQNVSDADINSLSAGLFLLF